jgi:DNA-binding PadR family transcriptional regulator
LNVPTKSPIESLLPLKPAVFLVLLVLSKREAHGYAIKKEVATRSDRRIDLEPGTLYRLMARLLGQRLIEESDRRPAPEADDERRRYYRITELGREVLSAEAARLSRLVSSDDVRALAQTTRLAP